MTLPSSLFIFPPHPLLLGTPIQDEHFEIPKENLREENGLKIKSQSVPAKEKPWRKRNVHEDFKSSALEDATGTPCMEKQQWFLNLAHLRHV